MILRLLPLACSLALAAAPAAAATLSSEQTRRVAELKKIVGDPANDPMPPIEELAAMGEAGDRRLAEFTRVVLGNDRRTIEGDLAQVGDAAKLAAAEAALRTERAAARAVIKSLGKDTVKTAKEHYDRLAGMHEALDVVYAARSRIATALARRPRLLELLRRADPDDTRFEPADEERLASEARAALGSGADLPGLEGKLAEDDPRFQTWFYACCRRVEAWNAQHRAIMSSGEWDNACAVNRYREYLGIMPYEIDPRLLQAARKHTKEMVELNYFGHSSPVKGRGSHTERMRLEGFKGGMSENCAYGSGTGEGAFWQWFSSPGHHKNMAGGCSHFGVGQWGGVKWTQVFGNSKRLMLMSDEERKAHAFAGEPLHPQDAVAVGPGR